MTFTCWRILKKQTLEKTAPQTLRKVFKTVLKNICSYQTAVMSQDYHFLQMKGKEIYGKLVQISIILHLKVKPPTYFPLNTQKQLLSYSTAKLCKLPVMADDRTNNRVANNSAQTMWRGKEKSVPKLVLHTLLTIIEEIFTSNSLTMVPAPTLPTRLEEQLL